MMKALHQEKGATLRIDILAQQPAQDFIDAHASALDSSFQSVPMSDTMRQRLQQSDYIFSGIKTFHELNEAFPSLLNTDGTRKPFEQFLSDVRKIDNTYNRNYLRAEYNFVGSSASMAAKWERYAEDGDRYNLQYRTAGDDRVRPEHAELDRVTLPMSDPFWRTYYPPNGWNCRCTVVQVRKSKYPETPHDEAMQRGASATGKDTKGIFQFNPGIQQKTFPDYNPYTIKRCRDCDIAQGRVPDGSAVGNKLAFVPENELCAACKLIHQCVGDKTKTQTTIERIHYLHEMEPLLGVRQSMPTGATGQNIKVGFTKIGNEHLYSDTFKRSMVLRKEDLKDLGQLLSQATYIDDKELTEWHKYNIVHFHYYQAMLHGHKVRLNVATERRVTKKGQVRIRYYLYSINDIKE